MNIEPPVTIADNLSKLLFENEGEVFKFKNMSTYKKSTMMAPAYTITCTIARNCAFNMIYNPATAKKQTNRYNTLYIAFR